PGLNGPAPARRVAVHRHQAALITEQGGLVGGQPGAAGRDGRDPGEADGERVERALDQDGTGRTGGRQRVEQGALVEALGLGAVEVAGAADVVGGAPDESGDPAVGVADGEHDPVAEVVVEAAVPGPADEPGRDDPVVGQAARAQQFDDGAPG